MILFGNNNRPFELGPYPLERLPRDDRVSKQESARPPISRPDRPPIAQDNPLGVALAKYHDIFRGLGIVEPERPKAPVTDDLARRTTDIKGAVYFLDASQAGICEMPDSAWYSDAEPSPHKYAIVILQAHGRVPEPENLAFPWARGQEQAAANFRSFEIAIAIAEHIQFMGFSSKAHDYYTGDVDLDRLTVLAGLALRLPR